MFWRILLQLVKVSRARLLLALAAVVCGAAVSSALLNIHFDAERKLTQEFTTLGPNVIIAPVRNAAQAEAPLLDEAVVERVRELGASQISAVLPTLYFVGRVHANAVIVAGTREASGNAAQCRVGPKAASALQIAAGQPMEIQYGANKVACDAQIAASSGSQEDNQIAMELAAAQQLTGHAGKISLARVRVNGAPAIVERTVQQMRAALPGIDVRPIRQIAEAEGQILSRIRGLIFATVALILTLTALCVLSAMTALAMEHRRDVGLMKALGGEMNRVLKLFLCEIVAVGVAGGILGWAGGVALSAWVGKQVFASTIAPRAEVLPLTVALMTAVALAGAFPLRLLSGVRPGVILRGE